MLEVIDRFREKEARDELGIGVVRDAFADMLFPGTSTIQTRARYFLFVPWIYRRLESRRVGSARVAARARDMEVKLIDALLASDDSRNVIGRYARKDLKRLPSSVYWQGMGSWGIRVFPGSQDQYHRSLDAFYVSLRRGGERSDDGEPLDNVITDNWHAGLPNEPPDDFLRESSFKLTRAEAEYLRERIGISVPDTLLAFLVDRSRDSESEWVDFPWEHPQFGEFPAHIQEQLHHARHFSEAIHGAALLYNLMLSEAREDKDHEQFYRDWLREWAGDIEASHALAGWSRARFWELINSSGARVSLPTHSFVDAWLDFALSPGGAAAVESDARARALIRDRERVRKRAQARLSNWRALELWGGAAGADQFVYRWPGAWLIVRDILEGLSETGGDDA